MRCSIRRALLMAYFLIKVNYAHIITWDHHYRDLSTFQPD
jgi:hypothetical protein